MGRRSFLFAATIFGRKNVKTSLKKNGEFAILYRTNLAISRHGRCLLHEIFHIEFMADCLLST
jgi:hypothetical protein